MLLRPRHALNIIIPRIHRYHVIANLSRTTPLRDAVHQWNNVIKAHVSSREQTAALQAFNEMRKLGFSPDDYTYPFILKACGDIAYLFVGASVHALAFVSGLMSSNVFVGNAAIAMYGRCGEIERALHLFAEMVERRLFDTISWNSMLSVYVQAREFKKALRVFWEMLKRDDAGSKPDAGTLVNVLPACASLRLCRSGMEIHGYATRTGLIEDLFIRNGIVDMYSKCGAMDKAREVFEKMEFKDVVSWNAMVTGYSQGGSFDDALGLFRRMREMGVELNVVSWSAVISGYTQRGLGLEGLHVFRDMIASGSVPNAVTLISVLSGCAAVSALRQGKETHGFVLKQFLGVRGNDTGDEMMVINGLIDMYAKCKSFQIARAMFDSIGSNDRSVVTWTVMIGGYAQHGEASDALTLFCQMVNDRCILMPNGFTIACALLACARLGALRHGREIHAFVLRNRYDEAMVFISNCLIDMYAKSGNVDAARAVFNNMTHKNIVSWTSIMTGYGLHGRGDEAIEIFNGMRKANLPIDGVTFVVVLYACSHSGMVDKGIDYFYNMKEDFNVVPGIEHYACMVDLLGRAGRLKEVMKLIEEMPMEPNPIIWVALLSSCKLHGNVELGEYAAKRLLELNFENDGVYTLLSNIYASARRWKDVSRIRLLMKHSGIKKRPGYSWVQGKKGTATFFVGDKTHPMTKEIYGLLDELVYRIKIMGYVPETSCALHDVDDEEKGDLLVEHSEKLALAYGILTTARGVPIRITKNLRVCGDCHTAIMYISRIVEHEIILRDSSRFHHFKNGECSCKGYW